MPVRKLAGMMMKNMIVKKQMKASVCLDKQVNPHLIKKNIQFMYAYVIITNNSVKSLIFISFCTQQFGF